MMDSFEDQPEFEDWQVSIIATLRSYGYCIKAIKMARYYSYIAGGDMGLRYAKEFVDNLNTDNIPLIPIAFAKDVVDTLSASQRATLNARAQYRASFHGGEV